jgi:hypothetical protein
VDDLEAVKLLQKLAQSDNTSQEYTVHDVLIKHPGRVWLGTNKLAHQHIIQAFHNSGVGGHSGFHATYYRIKQLFSWPGMKDDIVSFIKGCVVCQQAKVEHIRTPGLLQPLPVQLKLGR